MKKVRIFLLFALILNLSFCDFLALLDRLGNGMWGRGLLGVFRVATVSTILNQ